MEKSVSVNLAKWPRKAVFLLVAALAALPVNALSGDDDGNAVKFSQKAELIFKQRCSACHTYGKGIKVGPDLKGVTERRKHDWLVRFIHQSSAVIQSGDPTARKLFADFKQQRMPDWTDLSEQDIGDILYYISIGGPDIKPIDERSAETATAADEEKGRMLFYGETRLAYGAPNCSACHNVHGGGMRGGALGPDLTSAYTRYQDVALTSFLRHPCFSWDLGNSGTTYLKPEESFALKAFLHRAALSQTAAPAREKPVAKTTPSVKGNR